MTPTDLEVLSRPIPSDLSAPPARLPLEPMDPQLTSLQRHVVLRYFMEGATEQEIALELGIRQQSVHAAKRGALTKLRKHFR